MAQSIKLDLTKTPLQIFSKNIAALAHIQQIISDLEKAASRKLSEKKRYLLSSYVIFLIASWESFIENAICCQMEKAIAKPDSLKKILKAINKEQLDTEGYRLAVAKSISNFHTPKSHKIDKLVKETLGLQDLSSHWHLPGLQTKEISDKLDSIYNIRGSLAHTGYSKASLSFEENFNYMEFLLAIAKQTEDVLANHISTL